MNNERRIEPRYTSSSLQLVAKDALRGGLVGSIANLSEQGMMLNASVELDKDGILQLELCRAASPQAPLLELALRITWVSAAKTPGNCWAGGKVIAISEAHAKTLRALLEEAQTTSSVAK